MKSYKLTYGFYTVLILVLVFNQFQLHALHILFAQMTNVQTTSVVAAQNNTIGSAASSATNLTEFAKQIMPSGIPPAYGAELGVSFDNAAAAIPNLAPYEQDSRSEKLTGDLLERYIRIGQQTACEFCCTAKTLVFPDGRKACGCAHSAAMRGVIAYLLEHTNMTDQEILTEATKWKTRFFPGPMIERYATKNGLPEFEVQTLQRQVGGC